MLPSRGTLIRKNNATSKCNVFYFSLQVLLQVFGILNICQSFPAALRCPASYPWTCSRIMLWLSGFSINPLTAYDWITLY